MAEGSSNHDHLSTEIEALSLAHRSEDAAQFDSEGEEEEEAEESAELMVTLGFVQPVEKPWKVARQHFPSKVGGAPAWLDPINIPDGESSRCGICGTPLGFLMQVYAPIGAEDAAYREQVFHRSLFVFVCPDMACLQQDQHHQRKKTPEKPCRSVKVFRSQMSRRNRFYSYEPPGMEGDDGAGAPPLCATAPLCTWCGTWKGTSVCGGCKQVRYCSRIHQLAHWRAGHDSVCRTAQSEAASSQAAHSDAVVPNPMSDNAAFELGDEQAASVVQTTATVQSSGVATAVSNKLWPEMELIVGEEEDADSEDARYFLNADSRAQHLLEDYETRRREDGGEEFSASDMQDIEESSREQQHWVAFQARLAQAPDQVLRYCRHLGAKPLWPSLEGQPTEHDIPPCANCGAPRVFEFQLLPQLLFFLGVQNEADTDSLDWATIAVYSCAASCEKGGAKGGEEGYVEEFPWVQLAVT